MLLASGIIILLILLTALYVAAEFAAVSARRSRLRRLAEDGNALAARLLPVLEDPHAARPLHRRLAGRHHPLQPDSRRLRPGHARAAARAAASSASAACEADTAESTVGGHRPALPDNPGGDRRRAGAEVARAAGPDATRRSSPCSRCSGRCASSRGRSTFLNGSGDLLLKLLRVPTTGHRHVHSPEEIELLIAESRDGGLLEPQEQVRLHRALRLGLAHGAAADGAARAPRGRRGVDALRRSPADRGHQPVQPAAGLPRRRSTTSSASSTPRTSSPASSTSAARHR